MSTRKIAVVGTGLAGLTAAHLLSAPHSGVQFEVHLFEKAETLGMDSSSVSIGSAAEGDEWRIDVPMRSFQGGYYPHLIALYRHLGVRFRQKDFSYCFSRFDRDEGVAQTTMIYNGASGREGLSRPGWMQDIHLHRKTHRWLTRILGLVLFWVSTLQLLVCYVRLILFAVPRLRPQRTVMLTFEEWVGETTPSSVLARFLGLDGVWRAFARDVLVPLFSAVCTAPEDVIYAHPVEDFLDYIWLTFGTHHYVVEKGVRDVVARLTTDVKNIHLSSQIVGVYVDPANPQLASIECVSGDCSTTYHGFHHIIFATQATRVGPMLSTYAASLGADPIARHTIMAQITTLEAFHYVRSVVINHTDASVVLPADLRDRRDLNLFFCPPPAASRSEKRDDASWSPHRVSSAYTMATHVLTPPPSGRMRRRVPVYQTTNPFVPIAEEYILGAATLERAVLTMPAKAALRRLCVPIPRSRWFDFDCPATAPSALGDLQGAGRLASDAHAGIWFVGSYASVGIPLLEGCVVSAKNVYLGICQSEGVQSVQAPWF